MDATIIHVMESWPLQLALLTPAGQEHVALDENARIHRAGVLVDPAALQPGQRVKVLMLSTGGDRTVIEVEIFD